MPQYKLKAGFARALVSRLELVLPGRTNCSLTEVELNPQFILTASLLLRNCKPVETNCHQNFMLDTISALIDLLRTLNIDSTGKLLDRDDKTLLSTLVVTKVLKALVYSNWSPETLAEDDNSELIHSGIDFNTTADIRIDSLEVCAFPKPQPLTLSLLAGMEVLLTVLSNEVNNRAFSVLRHTPEVVNLDLHILPSATLLSSEIRAHLLEIDFNILVVLKYLAACNSYEYYAFLHDKLFLWSERGEYIPTGALRTYSHLLMHIYFTQEVTEPFLRNICSCIPFIRSTAWMQLFLYYGLWSIQYQFIYRPGFYSTVVYSGSPIDQSCKQLFELLSTLLEEDLSLSLLLLSWYVLTCPSDFSEVLHKPKKFKATFNKRIRFLSCVLRECQSGNNLDRFECMANFFLLGSMIADPTEPVREFTERYLDEACTHLRLLRIHCFHTSQGSRYGNLFVRFTTSAMVTQPEKYIEQFTRSLSDIRARMQAGDSDPWLLADFQNHLATIRTLSKEKIYKSTYEAMMQKMAPLLASILENVCWISEQPGRIEKAEKRKAQKEKQKKESKESKNTETEASHTKQDEESDKEPSVLSPLTISTAYFVDANKYHEDRATFLHLEAEYSPDLLTEVENLLAALLNAFAAAPQFYLQCPSRSQEQGGEECMKELVSQVITPMKVAILFKSRIDSNVCFDAACNLARKLLHAPEDAKLCEQLQCLSFLLSTEMIAAASSTLLSFPGDKFQLCFLIFNRFLHDRYRTFWSIKDDNDLAALWVHTACRAACNAYEVLLLYALCTHNVQFFNVAKTSMRYYVLDLLMPYHHALCTSSTLVRSFQRILDDNSVFTGFVSLHKKFRAVLLDAEPTDSLCQVWLLLYQRWLKYVQNEQKIADDNIMFRHYTGFLMCTLGCFTDSSFTKADPARSELVMDKISQFYDNVVLLLLLSELVVRVVMKDALLSETHLALLPLICEKLSAVILDFVTRGIATDKAIMFVEEVIAAFTIMVSSKTDGAFALALFLPRVEQALLQFVQLVKDPVDQLKLKLRLCKLVCVIESDYERLAIRLSHKLRNFFARKVIEWLEEAVFFNDIHTPSSTPITSSTPTTVHSLVHGATANATIISPSTSSTATVTGNPFAIASTGASAYSSNAVTTASAIEQSLIPESPGGRTTDVDYLQMELAYEASKCLSLQLQELVLDIPDGTTESKIEQARNLAFLQYFLLFYKVLQKYTAAQPSPAVLRSRYKMQGVLENVLAAFSNVLESNSNIGMPFALPLGYHENRKIRAIFLRIFATMLSARKQRMAAEEFPEAQVIALSEAYEVFSAAAAVASPSEHNLLATSLHGLFAYTKKLDLLFDSLLHDEVNRVARASDIFRGNSCLTRLMSILAKDYGVPYMTVVLRPFIKEVVENEISFEVEKAGPDGDVDIFITLLQKLVNSIVNLMPWVPNAFKYICGSIYRAIATKFGEAVLIAVGLFMFLRFFCPAIISPESSFDMPEVTPKVKRSLIQVVKVIQYMANGSLANLKWAKLAVRMEVMEVMNEQIFDFLEKLALAPISDTYPFLSLTRKPYSSLRYIHKFFYAYLPDIRVQYLATSKVFALEDLHRRIQIWMSLDVTLQLFGAPKFSISLQGAKLFKVGELGTAGPLQFLEFMAKMAAKNIEMSLDAPVVHISVFHDGTPVVVANFRHIREIGYDINTFVYMLLDVSSQLWDNRFYCVLDFTRFFFVGILGQNYFSLMSNYAPKIFFENCARTYYYNLPRSSYLPYVENMITLWKLGNERNSVYFHTQQDDPEIIGSLCLEESVTAISQDVRAVYQDCRLYSETDDSFTPVTIKFGRKWLQLCYPRVPYDTVTVTSSVAPVETHMIPDLTRCEVTDRSGAGNEFTLWLNRFNYQVILVSPQRLEILRLLYFAMLRYPKDQKTSVQTSDENNRELSIRFTVLVILVFHGLLERDTDVRAAAAELFSALDSFFDLNLGLTPRQINKVTFPLDTTDFIVTVSTHLASARPECSYHFLKTFFANFSKLPDDLRLSGILYVLPWLDNIGRYVATDSDGPEMMAFIVRLFCRLTIRHRNFAPILNDKVWKKLFDEMALISILVDEIVAFAVDNIAVVDTWCTIIATVTPSVELCGEVVARINSCIGHTSRNDLDIAIQGKQLEITVLVKICGLLFFNLYVYGLLYLPDVFLFCALFIDQPDLEFGSDLQKLVINTLRAFLQNPLLLQLQSELIDSSVEYFSSQRAKMLFGLTSRERVTHCDPVQNFNRAMSFELLCDILQNFICQMGSPEEKSRWLARWLALLMDIAMGNSLFQRRALMVVCTLARLGVSDSIAGKILKLVSSMLLSCADFYFDCSICYCRLQQGLTRNSVYLPLVVWLVLCSIFLALPATYPATIKCISNIMKHADVTFLASVMRHRSRLEPLLSKFELKVGVQLNPFNYEFCVLFAVSKGLTSSQFRHNSLLALSTILGHKFGETETVGEGAHANKNYKEKEATGKIALSENNEEREANEKNQNEKEEEKNKDKSVINNDAVNELDPKYYYLLLMYLSSSDENFRAKMTQLLLDLPSTQLYTHKIPTVLIDIICTDVIQSRFVLILLAYIYRSDLDQTFKCRFVSLYCYLFKAHRPSAFLIFPIIMDQLKKDLVVSPSIEAVTEISRLLVQMIDNSAYSELESIAAVDHCLLELNFAHVDLVDRFLDSDEPEKASLKLMQNMIYRTFCNTFEGLRLDKF